MLELVFKGEEKKDLDMVATVNANADLMRKDRNSLFAIIWHIAEKSNIEALDRFVELGFNLEVRSLEMKTIIHHLENTTVEFLERLIFHRINLHAIDMKGETALLSLSRSKRNEPVQKLLIEKGLNPYQRDVRGWNSFDYQNLEIYRSVPTSLTELTFPKFIENKMYGVALRDISSKIENLGGLNIVMDHIGVFLYHNSLKELQEALLLNDKIEEASTLFKMVVHSNKVSCRNLHDKPLSFIPSMLLGDFETIFAYLDKNIEFFAKEEREVTYFILLGYFISHKYEIEDKMEIYKAKLSTFNWHYNHYTKWIAKMLLSTSEVELDEAIRYVEGYISVCSEETKCQIRFLQAMHYFVKGDNSSAEFMFYKAIQISNEYDNFYLKDYVHSLFMLDYLKNTVSHSE